MICLLFFFSVFCFFAIWPVPNDSLESVVAYSSLALFVVEELHTALHAGQSPVCCCIFRGWKGLWQKNVYSLCHTSSELIPLFFFLPVAAVTAVLCEHFILSDTGLKELKL